MMRKHKDFQLFDEAIKDFSGQLPTLEGAIGAYIVGQKLGWKPLLLIHDKKTIAKYEKILGLEFREELPDIGEHAKKSMAWKASQKISNYWKAVKGEIPGIRTPDMTK